MNTKQKIKSHLTDIGKSTNLIATELGISYSAAEKHLSDLESRNEVLKVKIKKRVAGGKPTIVNTWVKV